MSRVYIIYDGRACGAQGTDDAQVMFVVGRDRAVAVSCMPDFGQCALYSYITKNNELIDERWEQDYCPKDTP